jgi:membrane protein YqaA with SNARE-associated domain
LSTLQTIVLASSWTYAIFRFFRRLGIFGVFLLSALDSSFLFLPFGNDLLLIGLVSADRNGLSWILYVLMSVAGSMLGVFVIDVLMRKTGEKGLERFLKKEKIDKLKEKLETKTEITVFLAALLPPPFPFTAVVMTASALQSSRKQMLGMIFLGRLIRFTVEAVLAIYLGRSLIRYMNSAVVDYVVYGIMAIAIVGSVISIGKWLRSNTAKP